MMAQTYRMIQFLAVKSEPDERNIGECIAEDKEPLWDIALTFPITHCAVLLMDKESNSESATNGFITMKVSLGVPEQDGAAIIADVRLRLPQEASLLTVEEWLDAQHELLSGQGVYLFYEITMYYNGVPMEKW